MRRQTTTGLGAALLLGVVFGALAITGAFGSSAGPSASTQPASAPGGGGDPSQPASPDNGAAPDPRLRSTFRVLRRQRTTADDAAASDPSTLPRVGTAQREWGINPHEARVAYDASGVRLVVMPGSGGMCLLSVGSSHAGHTGCEPSNDAAGIGMLGWSTDPANGSGWTLTGVVPDGAHDITVQDSNGNTTSITPNADGAFVISLASAPHHYKFVDSSGTTHSAL